MALFADKWSCHRPDSTAREDLCAKVARLRDELLFNEARGGGIVRVLEGLGEPLFRSHCDGSAFVELLKQLRSSPSLALEVCRSSPAEVKVCFFSASVFSDVVLLV